MMALGVLRKPRVGMTKLQKKEAKCGLIFLTPLIIGFLAFYFLPMLASVVFSLFGYNPAVPDEAKFIGFQNWQRAIVTDREVYLSFIRTIKFAGISLPLTLGFALFLAIIINSKNVIGKALFRTLFYMPSTIPLVATVLIWNGVLSEQTGWINVIIQKLTGIQVVGTEGLRWLADPRLIYYTYTMFGLWGVGNAMIIFLAGLQGVPTEYYEAAEIGGANWFQRLYKITIPMITPVIFYQLVLGIIVALQYFMPAFVLNQGTGFPNEM